jgi:hypothetical protein
MDKDTVINAVEKLTIWWIDRRSAKIARSEHSSMQVNPFLAPLLCAMHGLDNVEDLSAFVTAGHFYIGHGTGFGKLVDEKILPQAFGTQKLDKAYRAKAGFTDPAFDDIDHIVTKDDKTFLLSQKASKWTIQLSQATGLNKSFKSLLDMRDAGKLTFDKIVVGVFYGHDDDLTDKYRILRGITTGAAHDVIDISSDVDVYAGRSFWAWLADDPAAQEWIMAGIWRGIEKTKIDKANVLPELFATTAGGVLSQLGEPKNEEDWIAFINAVNR